MKTAFQLLSVVMTSAGLAQGLVSSTTTRRSNELLPSFGLASTASSQQVDSTTGSQQNSSSQTIKAILFDIDGTLADSWKLGFDATQVVLERNNIPTISVETFHFGTRYSTPERLARHAGLEPGHEDFERVGESLGQQFDDFYVSLVSLETAKFYPGIQSMLQRIPAHVQLGALTNAAVRYADAVLKCNCPVYTQAVMDNDGASIFSRFGSIRGADNVPQPKPAPDGLWTVCNDLKVDAKHCVYVGDSPTDGMAAKSAGMQAIGVTWGSHKLATMEASFDHICHSVDELEELLLQLVS